jgi:hypothetical protein
MFVTAAGEAAADLNSVTVPFTCSPTVTASNVGGSGSANQTISSLSDGSTGSTCTDLQLPNLFGPAPPPPGGTALAALEILGGGNFSTTNTQWRMQGGTPVGNLDTNRAVINSFCEASQPAPTCFNIITRGNYTAVPANPVTFNCITLCTSFRPSRPATPVTGNAQWFNP